MDQVFSSRIQYLFVSLIAVAFLFFWACNYHNSEVDYNTDIKPLINKKCISCHGGVKQNGGFSLLSPQFAFNPTESGKSAIIPGNADSSEMIRRLSLDDLDERMPLDHDPLSDDEIELLKNWVNQGAKWGLHWSYQPIENRWDNKYQSQSEHTLFIDNQVYNKLAEIGLKPNQEATPAELLRRVSMDIIGIPAPQNLQEDYLKEKISYPELVNRLLELPQYGEKWASMWLDIARYADSKGFERDPSRNIWRYRDYVIQSFNKDKPYDQFIIEQVAGDMLESPTHEQLIATGFHRNTQTNDEGGTNNEEFRVKAVLDRVNTTWEGIMATTMSCVQCHSHPYDPITHEEYYNSYAFFNNTRDNDTHADYPRLSILDSLNEQKLNELKTWISDIESPEKADEIEDFVRTIYPVVYSIEADQLVNAAFYDTKYLGLRLGGSARFRNVNLENINSLLIKVNNYEPGGKIEIRQDHVDGPKISSVILNQKTVGFQLIKADIKSTSKVSDLFFVYHNPRLNNPDKAGLTMDWLYFSEGFPGNGQAHQERYFQVFKDLINTNHETTLIMRENPTDMPRTSHMFDRGNWLIKGKEVKPNVPSVLPGLEKAKKNRLDFAEWIANEKNPLTSRTYVNRIWEQLFGLGIVETVEDLGSQGSIPSHKEVLDFLSYLFMHDYEWSTKELIKTIVNSETYKQTSEISQEKLSKDPENKWLSRGPRKRAKAEQIRDQALYLSGKLSTKMFGPPVMPFQPEGIWQSPYSSEKWKQSEGEDQYRRAIYTMIKRTAIYPSMETFDMAQRQVCVSRRINTNSPLQALVTMNDPVYVEAAQLLADRMRKEGGENIRNQINFAYKLAMSKAMETGKIDVLEKLYNDLLMENYDEENINKKETIALNEVASAILNLDELLNY